MSAQFGVLMAFGDALNMRQYETGSECTPRVIFLVTGLTTGGAEMMLLKLCSQLDRRRFAPSVISLSDKGVIGPRIEALGIPVYTLGMRPSRPSLAGLLRLRTLVSALRPNLIQGW